MPITMKPLVLLVTVLFCVDAFVGTEESHETVSNCISISLEQSTPAYDPTKFNVTCTVYRGSSNCRRVLTVIDKEISVVHSPGSQRHQVAYFDSYTSDDGPTLHADYRARGAVVHGTGDPVSTLAVDINDGRCSDAGVYRCKLVFLRTDTRLPDSYIAETALPACVAGALASVNRSYVSGSRSQFTCRAEPALASHLLSLEVSAVVKGERRVVAFLSGYLNGGEPELRAGGSVKGLLDPTNATASFLSWTLTVPTFGSYAKVSTSCKAVYLDGSSGKVVEAFADALFADVSQV